MSDMLGARKKQTKMLVTGNNLGGSCCLEEPKSIMSFYGNAMSTRDGIVKLPMLEGYISGSWLEMS